MKKEKSKSIIDITLPKKKSRNFVAIALRKRYKVGTFVHKDKRKNKKRKKIVRIDADEY